MHVSTEEAGLAARLEALPFLVGQLGGVADVRDALEERELVRQDEGSVAEANLAGWRDGCSAWLRRKTSQFCASGHNTVIGFSNGDGPSSAPRTLCASCARPPSCTVRPSRSMRALVSWSSLTVRSTCARLARRSLTSSELEDKLRARELGTRVEADRADRLVVNDTELVHDLVEHGLGGLRRHGRPRPLPRPTRMIVVGMVECVCTRSSWSTPLTVGPKESKAMRPPTSSARGAVP